MDHPDITCEQVDRDDLDQRYLRGTLDEADAEAFEQHYFACDRCWALIQGGLTLGAARAEGDQPRDKQPPIEPPRTVPAALPSRGQGGRGARRWWQYAAAAVVLVTGSLVWYQRERGPLRQPADAVRGGRVSLRAEVRVGSDSLVVSSTPAPGAADYRLRVFSRDGTLLVDRESGGPSISVPRAALPHPTTPETLYVEVLARDGLRHPIAQSALTPFALTPP
jgi:putative zinc finger protein